MKLEVFKTDGSKTGEQITLNSKVFGIEPNDHAIWMAVTAERTNLRQGTSSAKNRSAVRGGGRKPWRQKGRGTARAGTIRSPLWRGGARIFGPTPKDYSKQITKKMSKLARKSALAYKAKDEQIHLVEDFSFETPKTKQMVKILEKLKLNDKKTILLVADANRQLWLSGRNIPYFWIREAAAISTYDILNADQLLIQKSALKKIDEVLAK